jgi:formamidopyrimidine-DNA glycosylase
MDGSKSFDFTKCQPVSMPELPEVEMARRYLEATSLSQTIVAAKVKDPRILSGVSAKQIEQNLGRSEVQFSIQAWQEAFP